MRTLVILATAALSSAATGCTTPENKGSAPAGSDAPAAKDAKSSAPSGAAYDFSKVDKLVTTAKTEEHFDAILKECMAAAFETARTKKIEDVDKDPAYFKSCKVGPARARAQVVIKESKPDKMHTFCITASMQAEEIAESGKAEAEEFKKLAKEIDKACGM